MPINIGGNEVSVIVFVGSTRNSNQSLCPVVNLVV